jgi:DNA helicase-2/ATP-dependent DNA helicase PcrA
MSRNGVYDTNPEKVTVSFYFFEGQEKISATRTKDEIEGVKKHIEETVGMMERSTFSPTPGKHCDFCEFRLICEAWN